MALGANRVEVIRMVVKNVIAQAGIGLCVGIPIAIFCGRLLQNQLYEVSRFDPMVLGGATLLLALFAVLAAIVPARRAASVDPNQALRID